MSDVDVLISNGTCYYEINNVSSDNVIPCGNAAFANYTCCQVGDFCLEANTCYNTDHETTYLAGCTDPGFTSPLCPHKGPFDQQLVGLVQCANSGTGDGRVLWEGCPGPSTRTELGAPSVCACTGTESGLFYAVTSLSALASLPTALGQTISFGPGHTPSRQTAATATSTSSTSSKTATSSRASTTSAAIPTGPSISGGSGTSSSSPTSSYLSAGAKAGIGIASAGIGLALIGLVAFLFLARRKRKQDGSEMTELHSNQQTHAGPNDRTPDSYYRPAASTFSGFKSELPAEDTATAQALRHQTSNSSSLLHLPGRDRHRDSNLSDTTGSLAESGRSWSMPGSPGSPGRHQTGGLSPSPGQGQGQGFSSPVLYGRGTTMAPISELHA